MAIKKIIKDSFEQLRDTTREMAKSSVKQVADIFSPWEMIRNSFDDKGNASENQNKNSKLKELQGAGEKHTPLNFDKLQKSYADQDKKNINSLEQRFFQMAKRDEEKILAKGHQEKAEKERSEAQEETNKQRQIQDKKRQQSFAAAPEGKSGRGTALMGKKRRKPTEPQPAETKPGGGKQ